MPLGCHLDSDHKALLLTPLRVLRIDLGSSPSDASHPTVHRMALGRETGLRFLSNPAAVPAGVLQRS